MNRTSKSLCLSLLLPLSCTLSLAQGFDLSKACDVAKLSNATGKSTLKPYFPPPNVTPGDGNGCWYYGTNSAYTYGVQGCGTSPYGCIRDCENNEQACVQTCYNNCGNANNESGGCFETCGDTCRSKYNSCVNKC